MTNRPALQPRIRALALAAAIGIPATIAGCKDFLTAQNPAAIPAERLDDTAFFNLVVNGVVGELQPTWPLVAYYSGVFTDELRNHHVFSEEILYDRRDIQPANGTHSLWYTAMQRSRALADDAALRFKRVLSDSANHDLRTARVYAYAGYSLILLAETECSAPLSFGDTLYSRPYTPAELFAFAAARFDSTIKIAAAAKAAATAGPPSTLRTAVMNGADSLRNLAYVGAARAFLGAGDKAKAVEYARLVQPIANNNFEFRIYFNDNLATSRLNNPLRDRMSGGAGVTSASVSGTRFQFLDDARVPVPLNAQGQPQPEVATGGSWIVPNSPPSYSTFDGTKTGADFSLGGYMRLASLLEARYILAEAEGPTAEHIAFIESRRTAFPSTTATAVTTAANFVDNLRDQRRRDFYLDGHRMGDLRRYRDQYNVTTGIHSWETGSMYGTTTQFSNTMCWPLNSSEINNNPNVPKS
jgi:hypothetical protein